MWISCLCLAGCGSDRLVGTGEPPISALARPELVRMWGGSGPEPGQFQNPAGIAVDASGDIYVADFENSRVQKFDADGAYLTSWGQQGRLEGEFDLPRDVALDGQGKVYVCEYGNHRVQVFDSRGRFRSMWGRRGTNPGELFHPVGLAIAGGRLFVVDIVQRVQRFDLQGGFERAWSLYDGSVEEFPDVFGIDVDPEGCVWVVERSQQRVRRFDPDGRLLDSWDQRGGAAGAFQGPVSIAVDRHGRVLVGDSEDNRIQIFDPGGRFLVQWVPRSSCSTPFSPTAIGLAVSRSDRILVLNNSSNSVLEFVVPLRPTPRPWWAWGAFGSGEGTLYRPQGIAVDNDLVYVGDDRRKLQVFTPGGDFLRQLEFPGEQGGVLVLPRGIATFENQVYVADSYGGRVHVFERSGSWLRSWQLRDDAAGQQARPRGIATDLSGNIYVCASLARIDVFDPAGSLLRSWGESGSGPGQFQNASAIAVAPGGPVYVADAALRRVTRFDLDGTALGDFAAFAPPHAPAGLATSPSGHVFVSLSESVQHYDADGGLLAEWGARGPCEGMFEGPGGVAVDTRGRVFVTDVGNNRVQVFLPPSISDEGL